MYVAVWFNPNDGHYKIRPKADRDDGGTRSPTPSWSTCSTSTLGYYGGTIYIMAQSTCSMRTTSLPTDLFAQFCSENQI